MPNFPSEAQTGGRLGWVMPAGHPRPSPGSVCLYMWLSRTAGHVKSPEESFAPVSPCRKTNEMGIISCLEQFVRSESSFSLWPRFVQLLSSKSTVNMAVCWALYVCKSNNEPQIFWQGFFSPLFIFLKTNKNNRLNKIYSRHMQSLCTLLLRIRSAQLLTENANTRGLWGGGGTDAGRRTQKVR